MSPRRITKACEPASIATYDPWGQETPAWSTVGNLEGDVDQGAFGSRGKVTERRGASPIVFMGARPYAPGYGRFLSIDPIEGGCANPYVYVFGDPLNMSDISGKGPFDWVGDAWDATGGKVVSGITNNACRIASVAGTLAAWAARGAAIAALGALVVASGGTAAVFLGAAAFWLGVASTAAAGAQVAAGAIANDRRHVKNGVTGASVGLLTAATWGAVLGRAASAFANVSRLGIYEAGAVAIARSGGGRGGGC